MTAQPPPPPSAQDIVQLPENVMESRPTLPAATHSTSVPSTQPGTSTTSKAQRKLASTWTGPVSLVPRFAWIAQLGTDFSIPLTASAGESTSVFNYQRRAEIASTPDSINLEQRGRLAAAPPSKQHARRHSVADKVFSISGVECVADRWTSRTSNAQSLAGEIV